MGLQEIYGTFVISGVRAFLHEFGFTLGSRAPGEGVWAGPPLPFELKV